MINAYFSANCSLTMENKWEEIFNYLLKGSYPAELNKGQKQSLRKYSSKFRIHGQYLHQNTSYWQEYARVHILYYLLLVMSIFLKDGELLFGSDRRVIKTKEEAMNLFKEFHASPIGGHTGTLKNTSCHVFTVLLVWHDSGHWQMGM